jgi:hypothetical protein
LRPPGDLKTRNNNGTGSLGDTLPQCLDGRQLWEVVVERGQTVVVPQRGAMAAECCGQRLRLPQGRMSPIA